MKLNNQIKKLNKNINRINKIKIERFNGNLILLFHPEIRHPLVIINISNMIGPF